MGIITTVYLGENMIIKEIFLSWGMLVLSVLFNVCGVFVIKERINTLGPVNVQAFKEVSGYFILLLKSPLVVGGTALFFISPFLFAIALSRMEISVAYPAQIGLNFLILIALACMFLGEQLSMFKILGMAFVFIGIFFLNK